MNIKSTITTSLFMLMFLVAFSTSAFSQTVINQNGDFSDATEGQTDEITNWLLEGTDHADFEVVTDPDDPNNLVLQVTLTDIDGINAWAVQAMNTGTMFTEGEDYQVSFRVRGDQDGTIQLDAGDGGQLWGQQITGGEWHTLETGVFTPTEDNDGERLIAIHFAHENNADEYVFYIDDIQVVHHESDDNGNGDNDTDPVTEIVNVNGDFTGAEIGQTTGITNWVLEGSDLADYEVIADPDNADNRILQATITNIEGAENPWNIQPLHVDVPMEEGEEYIITARIKYDNAGGGSAGSVSVDAEGDLPAVYGRDISSGEWEVIELSPFTGDADRLFQVGIHLGAATHANGDILYIDYLLVEKVEEADDNGDNGENGEDDESLAPNPPHAIGDIINYNGSFQHSELGETEPVSWTVTANAGSQVAVVDDAADEDGRALEFNVNHTGNTNWYENEVVNEPIHVLEGDILRMTVSLKADTDDRIARFYLGMPESGGWERARGWDTPELSLTDEWQEFTFEHTVTANNATHGMRAGIEFNSAVNDEATILIDNLQVEKIGVGEAQQRVPVIVEAESGELGDEWEVLEDGGTTYIVITTDFNETTGSAAYPGENRTASYTVSFPAEGDYDLYARVRVGAGNFDDDSFFEPHGFGEKDPSNAEDWFNVNGLAAAGYDDPDAVVRDAGGLGSEVWKWVNVSRNAFQGDTTQTFTVEGDLTKIFQIGAREDGQEIDKFAFGKSDLYFTVANLDNMEAGSDTDPRDIPVHTAPIADGKEKWLGNIYSSSQIEDFEVYWNQVTAENAGKWGSVESSRGNYNWTELDASYNLAKDNGFPYRFHILTWGGQQPDWINDLSTEEQLVAIEEWYDAVAERYPDMEYVEVVNEGSNGHQLPDGQSGSANYIEALGGTGDTGHDWIITAFEMARDRFPESKLMINDYNIVCSHSVSWCSNNAVNYRNIIEDLMERDLIDVIGVQAHAFSTMGSTEQIINSLDYLAETGLPIQATEMDIDGAPGESNEESDQAQLENMQRIFPAFWEHPAVEGVTFWGWRPGLWRQDQDAFLIRSSGVERPALTWLREYVEETDLSVSNEIVEGESPMQFRLYDNYPNPFNPTTQIRYDIARTSDVSVRVYDVLGRQVQTLVNTQQSPGTYTLTFDASNLSSGVYFYRIQTDSFVDVKQMMLVK
ncbi:T9SS C-terminal target domain-containing protein [Rhodohalobacter sp. SW132]|uniref:endo-1,4-beta-xylanase n=1 Tax=Rhodohalobacter sp. SW132 TaxID=2293433 RepID=UPI000E285931|nr:endo-1,4-beta-xylanase [Rhodohalobacter sp. SW132]REL38121.1 T9SS C-terminal target domain-containing protein [Rhodohalobacter sp. SW132]